MSGTPASLLTGPKTCVAGFSRGPWTAWIRGSSGSRRARQRASTRSSDCSSKSRGRRSSTLASLPTGWQTHRLACSFPSARRTTPRCKLRGGSTDVGPHFQNGVTTGLAAGPNRQRLRTAWTKPVDRFVFLLVPCRPDARRAEPAYRARARQLWPAESTWCSIPRPLRPWVGPRCARAVGAATRSAPTPMDMSAARAASCCSSKRLSDAEADGDRLLAVIRGVATTHGGRTGGLMVPSSMAQQESDPPGPRGRWGSPPRTWTRWKRTALVAPMPMRSR